MIIKHQIGNFLLRIKDPVDIDDSLKYKRITIRINHQGVSVRDVALGANIGTKKQFRVKQGQFILSKIDARQGAFGIVPPEADGAIITGNFWAYEVNPELVNINWFLQFTSSYSFLDLCKRSSTGNTHRKYLDESIFLSHSVHVPLLSEQAVVVAKVNEYKSHFSDLQGELQFKVDNLTRLRNALLQKSVSGELTSRWRDLNPSTEDSSTFLKTLINPKSKKSVLTCNPPDSSEFILPETWAWAKLGELCEKTGSGSTPAGGKTSYVDSGISFLRSQNIHNDGLSLDDVAFISDEVHQKMSGTIVYPGDLLLNITGGSIGRCAIVKNEFDEANINQHVAILRLINKQMADYLHIVINSEYFQKMISEVQTGAGREGLPKNKMDLIPIPIPPLSEQIEIVKKFKILSRHIKLLSADIRDSNKMLLDLYDVSLKRVFLVDGN